MSAGSSTNNSWTILTPEETVTETLKPLAEGTEGHEESQTTAAGSGDNQPANAAEGLPVEEHLFSEGNTADLTEDTNTEHHAPPSTVVPDASAPTSLDVPDSDALSHSEGLPEGPTQSSPDPDSYSDSYTHITPSTDEPPSSLLETETLRGGEFTQEETVQPLNGEEPQTEGEDSDLSLKATDVGKQADSPVDSEVVEEQIGKTGEEGEPELRRRRSLLAALERIGQREEEEEAEEEFRMPRREDDSGFSVNKCILGALILLGLGTIFISGVFMDLDEDSDYGTRDLKDAELPGKQEWLNPEVPPAAVEADSTELLNKIAEGNEQISVLQDQLQAQSEELKVAKGAAAEGAKESLRWEEVEKENSRLKKEMASLPVLLKENERMKRELESVTALQKELETLRSTVTELKLAAAATEGTSPSSGQPEDSTQDTAGDTQGQHQKPWDVHKDKKKERDKSIWKDGEKRQQRDGGTAEGKKGKPEHGKFEKEKDKQKWHSDEMRKDHKKEKASRGDEGKSWKDRDGKKEWKDKAGRKEWKEEKDWKKGKHEKVNEGKEWRGKEEKRDKKVEKEHREKHRGKEEWKGEKEWKKGKDGFKESSKEKWEKKDWKEKGEKKEWKSKDGKENKGWKERGERKHWEESKNHGKDREGKNERKQWNEHEQKNKNGREEKEWKRKDEKKQWEKKEEKWKRDGQSQNGGLKKDKKDKSSSLKHKDEHKLNHIPGEEHLWGDRKPAHSHRAPSLDQPEYWAQQRDRLQHSPTPPLHCDSLETCAQAEGLLPVPLPEFDAILQTYLAKAEEAGVDAAIREELKKLAGEFFKDGLFVHDQMSFQDFAEDVGDILEDMVEGDEDEEEDSAIEDEMEGFEAEVMKKFAVPGAAGKEERSKGEWRKESGRGRG